MIANSTLKSVGVIQEKNGRHILPIPRKSLVYVIPENKLQLFFIMRNRYILVIIIAFFIYTMTKLDLMLQGAIVAAILILLEVYYRMFMLGKFVRINNYKVAPVKLIKTENPKIQWIHGALYVVLSIAISYLGFSKYGNTSQLYLYQVGAIAILVFGYFQVFKNAKRK